MHHVSTLPCLDPSTLAQLGVEAGLDAAALEPLHDLAHRIAGDPQLRKLVIAAHHALFDTESDADQATRIN